MYTDDQSSKSSSNRPNPALWKEVDYIVLYSKEIASLLLNTKPKHVSDWLVCNKLQLNIDTIDLTLEYC